MPIYLYDNGLVDETPGPACGWPIYCCLCKDDDLEYCTICGFELCVCDPNNQDGEE